MLRAGAGFLARAFARAVWRAGECVMHPRYGTLRFPEHSAIDASTQSSADNGGDPKKPERGCTFPSLLFPPRHDVRMYPFMACVWQTGAMTC